MKKAIVIGGGIAGLASAKVLQKYFDDVILYDPGLPAQANHLHVLMKRGQTILESLFPGILNRLKDHQCPEIDWANDTLWINQSGEFPRYESDVRALSMGRGLLQKLMKDDLGSVQVIPKYVEDISSLEADLIIVATGQNGSHKSTEINLTYQSLIYEEVHLKNCKQMYIQLDPPYRNIGGIISPIENNQTMVTIIQRENTLTKMEFLEKAKMVSPEFYEAICNARPVTQVKYFRKTHTTKSEIINTHRQIFIGDVTCSLNPVFGQGMTLALIQVKALDEMLRNQSFDPQSFGRVCLKLRSTPILLSEAGSKQNRLLRKYLALCQKSSFFHRRFLNQLHNLRLL